MSQRRVPPGSATDDGAVGHTADAAFDVFLSYNHRDKEVVGQIAAALRRDGVLPWLDAWNLTPGGRWQDEVSTGLEQSRSCAVLLGPHDIGGWGRIEMSVALDLTARDPGFRVFPVLLPGLGPFDPNTLPLLLRTRTWVDLREGPTDPRAMRDFLRAVKGLPFGVPLEAQRSPGACPYRGLEAFDEEHAPFFFGREADTQRLLEQLRSSRFLAVLGPSGSGKSSLVRAGVVPALRDGGLPGSARWPVRVIRPGARPLAALAAELLGLRGGGGMAQTLDEMARDSRALHLAVELALAREDPETRALFVIDQFEEIFTLCDSESERVATLESLVHATTIPGGRTVVVLTMRADWYPQLAAYPHAAQLAQAHQALVGALDDEGLRRVVTGPAACAGLELEPGLLDTILDDVKGAPGGLPLLEHALLETWSRRLGATLTLAGYRESGGVRDALSTRAEQTFTELAPEEQRIARRVLLRLTQPGEGTEDSRRRAELTELYGAAHEREAVHRVVSKLAAARLLTATSDADATTWVDVSHEALIRGWPRLRGWIDEERDSLRLHRRLTAEAREWDRMGRDRRLLPTTRALALALDWVRAARPALDDVERSFLAAARRMRRLRRAAAAAAALVALVAVAWFSAPRVQELRLRQEAQGLGPMASFDAATATLGGGGTEGHGAVRRVRVAAFSLDRHEVTNGQYRLCVRARRCQPPAQPASEPKAFDELDDRLPALYVSAAQASVFCRWIGRRLPTEAQWERAARGTRGRSYPWGSAPATGRANVVVGNAEPRPPLPADDASAARGASPEDVVQLVGDLREYTSTPVACRPDPYHCTTQWDERDKPVALVTRGGSWQAAAQPLDGTDANGADPGAASDYLGFRCAHQR